MAVRSRTRLYKEYRETFGKSTRKEVTIDIGSDRKIIKQELLGANGSGHLDTSKMPPEWLTSVNQINDEIDRIRIKMDELSDIHKRHLLQAGMDDRNDERAIEILTSEVTRMFHRCQDKVKRIGTGEDLNSQEELIKKNVQGTLAQRLQDLSIVFRKHQKDYLNKIRGRQERGSRFVSTALDETDDDDTSFMDRGFDDNQMQMMNMTQAQIAQREKDIKQIAKSIQEIAVLFNDLATLVQEQGTILDRIDYNIEQASYHTKEAVVQLRGAQEESKKYGSRLCILLLIVLIFGVIVAIIVKVSK